MMVFVSISPFFVVHCTAIGTDSLAVCLGFLNFLCLLRLNRHPRSFYNFWGTIVTLLLQLFTKLNGVILLITLPWTLWLTCRNPFSWKKLLLRLGIIGLAAGVWLALFLQHAWVPEDHQFLFMKWAPFD